MMYNPAVRLDQPSAAAYPTDARARDRFVLDRRRSRPAPDPWTYQDVVVEDERAPDGRIVRTATVFLTGRECPWRCVMCDLWRNTIAGATPPGAIPAQIAAARERLRREGEPIAQIKLYNAGSFFDPLAVPDGDYSAIAAVLAGFARVVVESHPALVGPRLDRWLGALMSASNRAPALEVAMGLETAHPVALERLHKRMTLDQFVRAAHALRRRDVGLRAFVLIAPPFVPDDEQDDWLLRSVDVALDSGASAVSLIPTRGGNGALEALSAAGSFKPPTLDEVENAFDAAIERAAERGRVFVDLWDLERFAVCAACLGARRDRLHAMNLRQQVLPRVICTCGFHNDRCEADPAGPPRRAS